MILEIGVRIPLVTALTEELLFRSVLLAVLWRRLPARWAVAVCSALFGAWHLSSVSGAGLGDVGILVNGAVVVGATTLAGLGFCLLRISSGSVIPAWFVHASLNAATYIAGAIITTAS